MRTAIALLAFLAIAAPAGSADHESRFQLSGEFVANVWKYPVQSLPFTFQCAGPVHTKANDCELHLSLLLDDAAVSDFQYIVGEPPNVCIDDATMHWRDTLNQLEGQHCEGRGVVRVWPEHLTSGSGCSNPEHFMELHPMLSLACAGTEYNWTDRLYAVEGLGYKPPATVRKMLSFRLWVRSSCTWTRPSFDQPADVPDTCMVDFDYCSGDPCTRSFLSNFARLSVRPVVDWIRPRCDPGEEQRLSDFTTVLARAAPIDQAGEASDEHHGFVKLYAVAGTSFHEKLRSLRPCGSAPTEVDPAFDLIAMFMADSLAVVRALEDPAYQAGEWVEVTFPVALVVFGEVGGP